MKGSLVCLHSSFQIDHQLGPTSLVPLMQYPVDLCPSSLGLPGSFSCDRQALDRQAFDRQALIARLLIVKLLIVKL